MALEQEFYTVKELAELLKVTEMTVRRMMRRGDIPYHNIGRAKRFRRDDIEAFLQRVRINGKGNDSG